ncbi:MAG: hypothetical protein KKA19_01145, partial [Candidatus Margulisbacteria bacterium]|nr:hypothetical protein [Candidatus Margulisiibacteriota bacterium]
MINQILANIIASKFEKKVKGIFKKYGLNVKKLDCDKSTKSSDYLVCNNSDSKKCFICECKYISSAGYIPETGQHKSTLENNSISFFRNNLCQKIKSEIHSKINQYKELINAKPKYAGIPFVIAFELDWIIEGDFDLLDLNNMNISELSAIMKIEKDLERKEFCNTL